MGDSVDKVLSDLDTLLAGLPDLGAELNGDKCELSTLNCNEEQRALIIQLFQLRLPTIKIIPAEQLDLLGAPLQDAGVPKMLQEKQALIERLCSRLEEIEAHPALVLLKNCFSLPKLMYVLRTSSAYKFPELLVAIDETIRQTLTRITNVDISNDPWRQARLPVRFGGLGIRTAEHLAASAFLASHYATEVLVERILAPINLDRRPDIDVAFMCWQNRAPNSNPPDDRTKQKVGTNLSVVQSTPSCLPTPTMLRGLGSWPQGRKTPVPGCTPSPHPPWERTWTMSAYASPSRSAWGHPSVSNIGVGAGQW